MAPRHFFVHGALAALVGTAVLLCAHGAVASGSLPTGCTASGGTVTCSYSYTGSALTFTVPAGVTQVRFTASGAAGALGGFSGTPSTGPGTPAGGGFGDTVSTTVTTQPGATFTLTVGGQATNDPTVCAPGVNCVGGYNGGGSGGQNPNGGVFGGGGGGASDVRDAGNTRILVAAGGGGGGAGTQSPDTGGATSVEVDGGDGGDAEHAGSAGADETTTSPLVAGGGGGGAGGQTAGGKGGAQTGAGASGSDGADSTGGTGALSSGGGGGGGYFGGGGGGAGAIDHGSNNRSSGGGGGGGGSSFPASASPSGPNNGAGEIKVSYSLPTLVLSTTASAAVTLGAGIADTATLTGGAAPTGQVRFDLYGPDDATCTGTVVATSTNDLSTANGVVSATSNPFTPTVAGTYDYVAHYLGDANNGAVDGACGDRGESVVVTRGQTTSPGATTSPGTPTGTTPTTPATVPPTPAATFVTASRRLAYTGSSVGPMAAVGVAAISAGVCLMLIATAHPRRSRRQH